MAYVKIKNTARNVDTEDQILTARFEMALAGIVSADVYDGDIYDTGEELHSAGTLDELCELLREVRRECPDVYGHADFSSLPTYGGETPHQTMGIWSWDDTRKMVDCDFDGFKIVDRFWDASDYLAHSPYRWADLCRLAGVDAERNGQGVIASVAAYVIAEAEAEGVELSDVEPALEGMRDDWRADQ